LKPTGATLAFHKAVLNGCCNNIKDGKSKEDETTIKEHIDGEIFSVAIISEVVSAWLATNYG
jgi:hypothetical protein